jgi:1-phosphofructokinase
MISLLGAQVVVCTALGGEIGGIIGGVLKDEAFMVRAIRRGASNGWYVHDRRDGDRGVVAAHAGPPLSRHDLDDLYTLALAEGLRASVAVLSGAEDPRVVPPDILRRLAADLTVNGVKVIADVTGDYLTAVLAGGVAFLKISHRELIEAGRARDDSVEALADAAMQLRAQGAGAVLISRSHQPALASLDGELWEVGVPPLQEADYRGAGDSMTAAVAAVIARDGPLTEAVRTGAAAGAVNVTRHGLGTGQAEAIAELVSRVRLTPLGGDAG